MQGLPFRYVGVGEFSEVLNQSVSQTWADISAGKLPKGEKHGKRRLWRSDVVAQILEERSAQAQAAANAEQVDKAATQRAKRLAQASVASPKRCNCVRRPRTKQMAA